MAVVVRFIVGALLIAHGLVHLLYLVDDVEEFTLERSRLVPEGYRRQVAVVLMAGTVAAFGLVGVAVWGVSLLAGVWPALTVTASVLSLILLACFWHPRLVIGVTIDIALIVIAVTRPGWTSSIG
jgi:hypothetical protein